LSEGYTSFLSEFKAFFAFFKVKVELIVKLSKVLGVFLSFAVFAIVLMAL
jgi:hypothetical protein